MSAFKKSVKTYKGFKIHNSEENVFNVYTSDEWEYGHGMREIEHEAQSLQEAKDFIDSY